MGTASEHTGSAHTTTACGGRGHMKRKNYCIETWLQKAPCGYRCRGGRGLMGIWAVHEGELGY